MDKADWVAKPWIGEQYKSTRILIIGEASHSSLPQIKGPAIQVRSQQQITVFVEYDDADQNYRVSTFERVMTETLSGRKLDDKYRRSGDRIAVWRDYAFINYISDRYVVAKTVSGKTEKDFRPSESDWISGGPAFRSVLDNLNPKPVAVLVFGKETWNAIRRNHVQAIERQAEHGLILRHDGHPILMSWVNHPGAPITRDLRAADGERARKFLATVRANLPAVKERQD